MMPKAKYDLVERTLENVQYINNQINEGKILLNDDTFNEVTNLINNGLGLLSYVYQYAEDIALAQHSQNVNQDIHELIHNHLRTILGSLTYSETKYGKVKVCYPQWQPKDTSTNEICAVVYRMRNSICHCGVEPIGGNPDEEGRIYIEKIKFIDSNANSVVRFEAIMTIKQFYDFANDVADAFNKYRSTKH